MSMNNKMKFFGLLFATLSTFGSVQATHLRVEIGTKRSPKDYQTDTDGSVRKFAKQCAGLSSGWRLSLRQSHLLRSPFFLPVSVELTSGGRPLTPLPRGAGDIVPTFDTSGTRVFPDTYKTFLASVWTSSKPAIDAIFGSPSAGGTVFVRNFDADIQDRYAVAGGYYVTNGTGGPEIRFPIYNNQVAAAINYIHCLVLAYLGNKSYPFDAYQEGFARAATMLIARTPGSIPGSPTSDQIEAVLSGLYDVGPYYDWFNKQGIGGPKFIAPNLLNTNLPSGGSTGGIFLLRYQMAGTVFAKAAIRFPGFLKEFNRRYFLSPASYQTSNDLELLGQQVIDTLGGGAGTKIEGTSFPNWAKRQYVLDARLNPGLKLICTPLPLVADSSTSDFGVFNIVLNVFQTKANGDESLLSGSCYPIYWRPDFSRFFGAAQDDLIRIAAAYGSVTPNFSGETFNQNPYRVIVDLPMNGKNDRIVLPAGAYSTGSNNSPRSFIGTIQGLPAPGSTPYTVKVSWTGGSLSGIRVSNLAFGANITDAAYLRSTTINVQVLQGSSIKINRDVIKTEGNLALDLYPAESEVTYNLVIPAKLSMVSMPLEPFRPNPADILGISDSQTLFARWDSLAGKAQIYPDEGEWRSGAGYWVRHSSAINRTVSGLNIPGMPVTVSLNPGWNQFSLPFTLSTTTTSLFVTTTTEAIGTYAQAVNDGTIGTTIFEYLPDFTNPDLGTMIPATSLSPGKAYFIRMNRTEGGSLLIVPSNGPRVPDGGGSHRTPPQYSKIWTLSMTLSEWQGAANTIQIGQATNATRGYDLAIDTDLPPLTNGLQISSLNGRYYARDFRPNNTLENFDIRIKGLKVGLRYNLHLQGTNRMPSLKLVNGTSYRWLKSNQDISFTASETTKTLRIEMGGR